MGLIWERLSLRLGLGLGLSLRLNSLIKTPQKDVERNDERVKPEGEGTDLAKLQCMVWCELVQRLNKASTNFIRGHKPNGAAASKALTQLHKSHEQARVLSLMRQLTGLKRTSGGKGA